MTEISTISSSFVFFPSSCGGGFKGQRKKLGIFIYEGKKEVQDKCIGVG